jgi:hypothetical protein
MSNRVIAFTLLTCLGACAAEPTVQLNSWTAEAAGDNCALGGLKVTAGIDTSNDGVLDGAEVTTTEYLCNGAAGASHLTGTVAEPAGDNCVRGGYKVNFGVDANGDGALGDDEVTASEYLCNPERPTEGNLLMKRSSGDAADTRCAGGYVSVSYGFDLNGDAELSAEEVTGAFNVCNAQPDVTLPSSISVEDCGQNIEVTAVATDSDGSVVSYEWSVTNAATELTLTNSDTATVSIGSGDHIGGASLRLVVTDDTGGVTNKYVTLIFAGVGCVPVEMFYGVLPESCTGIDIEDMAGDDRGGAIVTSQYVYYNGDRSLVRADLDLGGLMTVGPEDVDVLFSVSGTLHALWSSELNFLTIAEARDGDLDITGDVQVWDQIALVDEDGLTVGAKTTLSEPIRFREHAVLVDGESFTRRVWDVLFAASGNVLVVLRRGYDNLPGGRQDMVVTSLYNLETGELISSSVRYRSGQNQETFSTYEFETQETNFVSAPVVSMTDGEPVLVYRNQSGTWTAYNAVQGTAEVVSTTFVDDCDVWSVNLAFGNTVAYFHDEGGCFTGLDTDESLIRCDVLFSSNLDQLVDDRGSSAP